MRLRESIARDFLLTFVGGNYETLKTIWIVVMGAAIANASSDFAKIIFCMPSDAGADPCMTPAGTVAATAFFFAYILIFMRFFWGDNRYVDWKYVQSLDLIARIFQEMELRREAESITAQNAQNVDLERNYEEMLRGHSAEAQAFDMYLLIVQSILFVVLGYAFRDPEWFAESFSILLLVNILWLVKSIISGPNQMRLFVTSVFETESVIRTLSSKFAAGVWIANNLVALLLLLLAVFYSDYISSIFALDSSSSMHFAFWLTIMFNNMISLTITHRFYFPRAVDIYLDLIDKRVPKQPGN